MNLVKLSTIALLPFLFSANASEPTAMSLINKCLSLQSTLSTAFGESSLETTSGIITGTNKASFHYQNASNSFKGVCSNAHFSIEKSGLKITETNQNFIYIWSSNYNAEDSRLSIKNIKYSLKQPKNIQVWLQEKV